MFYSRNLLAAVLCASSLAVADRMVCQTSDGSPSLSDCQSAYDAISWNTGCFDGVNQLGSGCKAIGHWGNCQIDICVDDNNTNLSYSWASILEGLNDLLQGTPDQGTCANNDKIGGYFSYADVSATNAGTDCYTSGGLSTDEAYFNVQFSHA